MRPVSMSVPLGLLWVTRTAWRTSHLKGMCCFLFLMTIATSADSICCLIGNSQFDAGFSKTPPPLTYRSQSMDISNLAGKGLDAVHIISYVCGGPNEQEETDGK